MEENSLNFNTIPPKYFNPFIEIIESLGLDHNYSYALANSLNNIMNIKIQELKNELADNKEEIK